MIEPPRFFSEARQEYDMLELEQLGHVAIRMDIHSHPYIKLMFSQMVDLVGTPTFAASIYPLSLYLSNCGVEEAESTFSEYYRLDESAKLPFIDCTDKAGYEADCEFVAIQDDPNKASKAACIKDYLQTIDDNKKNKLLLAVDAIMGNKFIEDSEISFKGAWHKEEIISS